MTIVVYTKQGCGICQDAKDKLDLMKVPYTVKAYEDILNPHPGWRTDGTVEARAMAALIGDKAPMIVINGAPFEYAAAMKEVKRLKREAAS